MVQSTSDIRDPPGPAQLIPYIRISLITNGRKVLSDTLKTQVLNAQNTFFEAFHTFPLQKARVESTPSEMPAKLKSERALLVILTHHQNKKSIPYNRLKLLENYDWDLEI